MVIDLCHWHYVLFVEDSRISDTLQCKYVLEDFNESLAELIGVFLKPRWKNKEIRIGKVSLPLEFRKGCVVNNSGWACHDRTIQVWPVGCKSSLSENGLGYLPEDCTFDVVAQIDALSLAYVKNVSYCPHVELYLTWHSKLDLYDKTSDNCSEYGKIAGIFAQTSIPASSRIAPIVDSVAALSGELILWRIELRASFWYSRYFLLVILSVVLNESVSMTALRRALSSSPFRRTERKFWSTSSSVTLKTSSATCWDLSIFNKQLLGIR